MIVSGVNSNNRHVTPSPPSSGQANNGESLGLAVGDRVTHDAYGLGTVVAVEGVGKNAVAKIDFGSEGTKRLLLRYSPVEKQIGRASCRGRVERQVVEGLSVNKHLTCTADRMLAKDSI